MGSHRSSIWLRDERSGRGPTPGYSRARLTAAAIAVADADGLAAVSMRRVAAALGSGPASLYRYVETRDELLALMLDEISGEYTYPETWPDDWLANLTGLARQARDIHRRHAWAADALAAGLPIGPNTVTFLDQALAATAALDRTGTEKLTAVAVLSGLVSLFGRDAAGPGMATPEAGAATMALLGSMVATGDFPHLAAAVTAAAPAPGSADALFDQIVGRVLTGLLGPT